MVICYTAKELTAIGEKVILNELLNRLPMGYGTIQSNKLSFYQQNFQPYQYSNSNTQQINSGLPQFIALNRELEQQSADSQQEQLTTSVAEFFKKAQQNFYAQSNIDPTKVRRLSEVEAEMIGGSRESC